MIIFRHALRLRRIQCLKVLHISQTLTFITLQITTYQNPTNNYVTKIAKEKIYIMYMNSNTDLSYKFKRISIESCGVI